MKKKICVFISNRANYSSIKTVLEEIKRNKKKFILQLIVGSGAISERYGSVSKIIKKDGFNSILELNVLVEGSTPESMTKTSGLAIIELSTFLKNIKPHLVIVVGDRFENMSFALAAAYMNIPIAHTMGGEISGTIDESIRHAITKFSHLHFVASKDSYNRVLRLGEKKERIFNFGCPRIDLVKRTLVNKISDLSKIFVDGVGDQIDLNKPFIIVSQHPVTTEYGKGNLHIELTLKAVKRTKLPAIILWPNPDAGSEDIARTMRSWREMYNLKNMHFFKNIETTTYIHLLNKCQCLVGNSSSGIREGAYIGVPVVNIGTRQSGRLRGRNVIDTEYNENKIYNAILKQARIKKYKRELIYGDGNSAKRICKAIYDYLRLDRNVQKRITY
jgi:UDP-hydrolysing UDP-N-acetyl-D-glucosamine 2-epimerase